MAKKALSLFRPSTPAPVVVMAPSRGGKVRRAARRVGSVARRAGRRAGGAAKAHVPAMGMAVGAAIAGALDAKGVFAKLPALGGSRALTLALAGYAATRFSKHPTVRAAGLAAISVGVFDVVKNHLNGAAPAKVPAPAAAHGEDISGHDDASGQQGDGGPY